jgi:hypothetical protein
MRQILFLLSLLPFALSKDCSCPLATPEELVDPECRVYATPDGNASNVFGYNLANRTCLDDMGLTTDELEFALNTVREVCPNPNGTDFQAEGFVKVLVDGQGPIAKAIKADYPEFFNTQDNRTTYDLNPTIEDNRGEILDCEASRIFCINFLNYYVSNSPSNREADYICRNLYELYIIALREEQGKLRSYLCANTTTPASCGSLAADVEQVKMQYGVECAEFVPYANVNVTVPESCPPPPPSEGGTSGTVARGVIVSALLLVVSWMI